MNGAKPVIYGYVRLLPDLDDQAEVRLPQDLADFALAEGFALGEVFVEHRWLHSTAWEVLVEHCYRHDVHNVVVPTTAHLHSMPALSLVAQVVTEEAICGRVWFAHITDEEAAAVRALLDARPL